MVQHPNQITAGVASPTRLDFAEISGRQRTTGSTLTQEYRPARDDGAAVGPRATCS